ncbi:MAG: shikimate kinase [Lachnospiraceae bacterium]|nr:shikimate kinase [Lachnospiraceae bacterium]
MKKGNKQNIILIGMPGAGKSTVGVVLAKRMGYRFADSDLVIQERTGKLLHQLIEIHGLEGFLKIEDQVNASLDCDKYVIATGGSVVYGREAMDHLRDIGTIVYLKLSCREIEERLGDLNARGVACKPGQTLLALYEERCPLYERYADIVMECDGQSVRRVVEELAEILKVR